MEGGGVTAEQVAKAVEDLLLDYPDAYDIGRLRHGLWMLIERVRG